MDNTEKSKLKQKYRSKKQSCKARGIIFELSLKEYIKLMTKKRCQYTKRAFSSTTIRSINRIDNTKGYIKGNCVACCQHLNAIKSNAPYEDIIGMAKYLKKFKKKKK